MLEYLVFVAAFATLLATFVYVRSMFKGGAKPNRVSWLMWTTAPFIATAAAKTNGVGLAALPVFMSGLSPFIIFTASFISKKAQWTLISFDYGCGLLSGLALVLWYVTKNPNAAITFAIASDGLASIPTLTKAWNHPETEVAWPFMVGVFNASTSFSALTIWTFSAYAFPTYLIVINILLSFSVYKKKLVSLLTKRETISHEPERAKGQEANTSNCTSRPHSSSPPYGGMLICWIRLPSVCRAMKLAFNRLCFIGRG